MALPGPPPRSATTRLLPESSAAAPGLHLIDHLVQTHLTGFVLTIEWVDGDGTIRRFTAFPQGRATHTNPSTGESVTVNAAGPERTTVNPDGSFTVVGTGTWGFANHPETGAPEIFQVAGRWVFSVDAQGNESFRFVGRVRDLCAELAA